MTAYLSPDEIAQRRNELGQVEEQLKALGRRRSVLRAEILSGFAAPVKGAAPEQLSLTDRADLEAAADEGVKSTVAATTATPAPEAPSHAPEAAKPAAAARSAIQLREAVLAALRAAKGRRSGRVLATLLGESEEDVHECLVELIERGEARSARRGGYEATDKPQARGRDVKSGKAAKKPVAAKSGKALWKPGYKPGIIPSLTAKGNRLALKLISAAPGKKMLASEVRKALDLPDDCCIPSGCYYQGSQAGGSWWGIRDDGAPAKSTKPAAKKQPPSAPTPTVRGLVEDIATMLADGAVVSVRVLAQRLQRKPKQIEDAVMHSDGRLVISRQRVTPTGALEGVVQMAPPPVAPPPAPQVSRQELLRKAILDELGHGLATFGELLTTCMRDLAWTSERMPQTTEVRQAIGSLCEEKKVVWDEAKKVYHLPPPPPPEPKKAKSKKAGETPAPAIDWRQERKEAVAHIAAAHRAGARISAPPGTARSQFLAYLGAAGALAMGTRGWDFELSCEIDGRRVSEGVWRMSLDYLLDQIEENAEANGGVWPTAASLAELLEAPCGLVDDLVAELLDLERLREVPQTVGASRFEVLPSPKQKKRSSAATRTAPLFEGVEPAPAGEEAAE